MDLEKFSLKNVFASGTLLPNPQSLNVQSRFAKFGLDFTLKAEDQLFVHFETSSLKSIMSSINERFDGDGIQSTFLINGKFGSGKTHLMLNLETKIQQDHHYIVKVDGHQIKRSIWNEVRESLRDQEIFSGDGGSGMDETLDVPSLDEIIDILGHKKIVFLIDEIVVFLKKAKSHKTGDSNLAELNIAFLHTFSVAINRSKHCCLILSLPEFEEAYLDEAKSVFSIFVRQAPIFTPIQNSEVASIINSHFFDNVDTQFLVDLDQELSIESGEKRDYIHNYPFHPKLIAILWEELAPQPGFQYMRGILRLLSLSIPYVIGSKEDVLISHIPLQNPAILNEITSKLGKNHLKNAISSDLILIGSDPVSVKIASIIALRSIIGKSTDENLVISLLCETHSIGLIKSKLDNLPSQQQHLHNKANELFYTKHLNLWAKIVDETKTIMPNQVKIALKTHVDQNILLDGLAIHYFMFPENPSDTLPNVLVCDWNEYNLEKLIRKNTKGNFRSKLNNLFVLSGIMPGDIELLNQLIVVDQWLADDPLNKQLIEISMDLKNKVKYNVLSKLRNITYLSFGKVRTIQINPLGSTKILDQMTNMGVLLDQLGPQFLIDKILADGRDFTYGSLKNEFLTNTQLFSLTSQKVLKRALLFAKKKKLIDIQHKNQSIDIEGGIKNEHDIIVNPKTDSDSTSFMMKNERLEIDEIPQTIDQFEGRVLVKVEITLPSLPMRAFKKIHQLMNLLKLGLNYDNASLHFRFEKEGEDNFDARLSNTAPNNVQIYLSGLQNMITKLSTSISSGQIQIYLSGEIDKRIFSSLKKMEKYGQELNFEYQLVIE